MKRTRRKSDMKSDEGRVMKSTQRKSDLKSTRKEWYTKEE